jgi:DNA repair exonuclease SbcCD ATPase subunit
MLKIKSVSLKNFLSVGAVTQAVDLDRNGLTLVLGDNLDLGGNGSRNGVGKSTILQAISYGLYGEALTNIKRDNLVNKINGKNMAVSIEFELNGQNHKIERGRKPQFFRWIVDDVSKIGEEATDEAQGDARDSQKDIVKLIGMSHTLFKHIVALNTYTEPFLAMGAAKQREIIEELLGITMLSQKAENLKELIKATKTDIEQEEFRIRTVKTANEKIAKTIEDLQNKIENWDLKHSGEIATLEAAIEQLELLDIESELENHKLVDTHKELSKALAQLRKDQSLKSRHAGQLETQLNGLLTQFERASVHKQCPMCEQQIKDHKHDNIIGELESKITTLDQQVNAEKQEVQDLQTQIDEIEPVYQSMGTPTTFYPTLTEAVNHKSTVESLHKDLGKEHAAENPYLDQADSLQSTVQEVNHDHLNLLVKGREHQEFLLKLLTNKDSFIRKRIIDQNLAYLNSRLNDYLDKLGLPHSVKFLNDLTTEISLLGQDLDFDNLSRGERTRLILGLSWSFRDIFENMNQAINLLFVDELLDSGLDPAGLEGSVAVLKRMERERGKNVFVISHREELITRVSNVLSVIKENSFTSFSYDHEIIT